MDAWLSRGSREVSAFFIAVAVAATGTDVVWMLTAGPDHGAGPQGEHMKVAALDIANVSVPCLGHQALSVLLWPFNTGTL